MQFKSQADCLPFSHAKLICQGRVQMRDRHFFKPYRRRRSSGPRFRRSL
jgi:hypothetical protein